MLKTFSKNIVWYGGSQAIKSLIPFIMLPILTHYLSVAEYGILSLIEVFILFLFPIVSINIHSAINVQYFKLNIKKLNGYISNAILLSFFIFLIIEMIFIILGYQINKVFKLSYFLIILLPLMALIRLYPQIMLSLYQAQGRAKEYFLFILFQSLLDFILSILFVVIYMNGYIGRLEGIYLSFLLFTMFTFYLLYKNNLIGNITLKYSKQIFNYGFFLIPHAISGVIMAMSDRFFISYFYDNFYVGIYTVAYQLSAILLLIGVSVNKAWSPFLYKMLKQKKKEIFKYVLIIYGIFSVMFLLVLFSKNLFFSLFVSSKFYLAKDYFDYLLIGFLFQIFYMIITNFLFFYESTRFLSILTVSGAILNILLNYILIKMLGVKGVAIATMITWMYYFFIVLLKVKGYKHWKK